MAPGPNVQRSGLNPRARGARKPRRCNGNSTSVHTLHVYFHDFPYEKHTPKVRDLNVQNVHHNPQTAETQRSAQMLYPIQQCDCGHVARIHGPTPGRHITATECRACTCRNFTTALDQPD